MDLRHRSSQRDNEQGKIHVRNRISHPPQRADRDRRMNTSTHSRTHEPQSSGGHKNDNDTGNKSTHNMDLRWQQGSTNAPQRHERRIGDSGTHSQRDSYRRDHTSDSSEVSPNRFPILPPQYETNNDSQAQTGIGDTGSHSQNYNRSLHLTLPVGFPPMSQPPPPMSQPPPPMSQPPPPMSQPFPPLSIPQPGIINENWKIPKRKAPNEEALTTSKSKKDRENDQHFKTSNWFASQSQQIKFCEPQDYDQRSVPIDEQAAATQMLRPYRKPSRPYDRPQQRGVSVARFNFQKHREREASASDKYGDNQAGSGNMHHIDVLRQDQSRQKDQSYDSRQLTNARSFEHISRHYDESRKKFAPRINESQSSQQSQFQDQHRPEIRQRQEQQNDSIHVSQQWKSSRDLAQRRVFFRDFNERSASISKPGGNLPMSLIPSPPVPPMSPPPPLPSTSGNVYVSKQIPSILSNLSFDLWPGQAKIQSTVNSNQSRYGTNSRSSRPMRSKSVMNVKYTQSASSITAPKFDREAQSSAPKTANFVSPRTARLSESAESNSTAEFGQYRGNITTCSSGVHSFYPCATVSQKPKGYSQFVLEPQQQPLLKVIPECHEVEPTQSHERIRVTVPNSSGIDPSYTQPSPKIPKQGERTTQEMNLAELADREIMVRDFEENQSRPGSSYRDVGPRGEAILEQNQCRIVTNRSVSDRTDVFNTSRMSQLTSNDRIPVSNFAICSVRPFGFLSAEDDREQSRETEEYNSEDSPESVATAVLHSDRTELFKIRPEPKIVVGDPNPWPGFTGYPDHIFEHCETADDERCAKEQFELWNPHLFPQKVDIHKEIAQLKAMEDSGGQEELGPEKSRLDWLHSLSANGGPANFGPNMLDRIVDYVRNLEKSGQEQQENQPTDEQRILKVIVPNSSQSALYSQNPASGRVVNFQRSAQERAER